MVLSNTDHPGAANEAIMVLHHDQPVTNDLERRVAEHRAKTADGFTRKYNIVIPVYAEEFTHIGDAIAREKQLKGWSRAKKIALIERDNPDWRDIFQTQQAPH